MECPANISTMLMTFLELAIGIVGLALIAIGIYGIIRGKYAEKAAGEVLGATVTVPVSGLLVILGMCGIGFALYAATNLNTKSPSNNSNATNIPTSSPLPVVSTSPEPTSSAATHQSPAGTPAVKLDSPESGAEVPESGFTARGTYSSLGVDTIWILDYDGGTSYTIDESADVGLNGTWSASDGPLGKTSSTITMRVILANSFCNNRLTQLSSAGSFDISNLPSGCRAVAETTVKVSQP
jgi:hypothetical protein